MKRIVPLLAVLLLSCSATAADISTEELLSQLSQCPRSCLDDVISKSGCSLNNTECACTNEKALPAALACVHGACSVKEALTTQNLTSTYCNVPVRDRSRSLIKLTIIFGVLSGTSVLLRIACKVFLMHSDFGLDDLFTILSFCFCVPMIALAIHGTVPHGLGKDIWTLDFDDITTFLFFFYLLGVFYFPLVSLIKMSLLFFYLRIFVGPTHKLLWGTIIFNAIYGILFTFLVVFQCTPISYYWTSWDGEHEGTCLNPSAILWANAAISIALDIWMLAVPLWSLQSLRLHWKKKIGVAAMFIVGTFITIVSIIRLQSLVNFDFSRNPTYEVTKVMVWSAIETHVGVICASMPALRMLLVRLVPVLGGSSYGSRNHQNYGEQYHNHSLGEHGSRGKSTSRSKDGGIELQRTFEVRYGDGDETRLVTSDCFSIGVGVSTRAGAQSTSEASL